MARHRKKKTGRDTARDLPVRVRTRSLHSGTNTAVVQGLPVYGWCSVRRIVDTGCHEKMPCVRCIVVCAPRACLRTHATHCNTLCTLTSQTFSRSRVQSSSRASSRSIDHAFSRECVQSFSRSCFQLFMHQVVHAFSHSVIQAFSRSEIQTFRTPSRSCVQSLSCWTDNEGNEKPVLKHIVIYHPPRDRPQRSASSEWDTKGRQVWADVFAAHALGAQPPSRDAPRPGPGRRTPASHGSSAQDRCAKLMDTGLELLGWLL